MYVADASSSCHKADSSVAADLNNPDPAKSKLPTLPSDAASWADFLANWITVCKEKNLDIFGIQASALSDHEPTIATASFPPTSLRLQGYPYIAPGGTAQQGLDQVNNCLVYTQMTLNHPLPQNLDYPFGGNLVDPGQHGTEIISRATFWDNWLLPNLAGLNQTALLYNVRATCDNNEVFPNWNYSYKFGNNTVPKPGDPQTTDANGNAVFSPSFFQWVPKVGTATEGGFTWSKGDNYEDDEGSAASKLEARFIGISHHVSFEILY